MPQSQLRHLHTIRYAARRVHSAGYKYTAVNQHELPKSNSSYRRVLFLPDSIRTTLRSIHSVAMSSPIAIPRVTVESTDPTTHSPSTSSKYVPVHRRQASDASTRSTSPSSSRAPSPTPSDASSWRSHAPASPQGRRFATKAFANHHNHVKGVYSSQNSFVNSKLIRLPLS